MQGQASRSETRSFSEREVRGERGAQPVLDICHRGEVDPYTGLTRFAVMRRIHARYVTPNAHPDAHMTDSPPPWLSMVIPIKDERDNLQPLTTQLTKVLGSLEQTHEAPFEIVYVDDGSTDGSSALLDEIRRHTPEVRVLHFDRNYGQTEAFAAGFRHARGALIATLDGDRQYDPADISLLLPLINDYDLVCGRRRQRLDTVMRRLASRLAYLARNVVLRDGIHDSGCSLKIFRRPVIERIPLFHNMHRFFPALARMHGFSVTEVPVQHFPRTHGRSKYGIGNRLLAGLYDILAVRWMQTRCLRYEIVPEATDADDPASVAHHDPV